MQIKWNNIIAVLLGILAIAIFAAYPGLVAGLINNLRGIGPGHPTEDKVMGLIAFGLIGILLVAIVLLLTHNQSDGR
ncbi:MAG: hypothetical protein IT445_10115 [Phycisphaeraceae bacterium]|nr:hypothetical protein [Phycisphaeraceae bacterium]